MINELATRTWKVLPEAKLGAWAYQDFWYPPTKVTIDPRLSVLISFNNQCWRHSVDDPAFAVNGEFRKIFGLWKKTGLQVYNRDEIADEGSPGRYLPSEHILYRNMLAYPQVGCAGDQFFVYSPFPEYLKWAAKWRPYFGKNYWWRAMWQTAWITAQIQWDATRDFDALYEECNALYYGKAWEGGMKEFRRYLTECFVNTPGYIGYGSGAPIGKCLNFPGSQERLEKLLGHAIACAKANGDARALKHLETDRDITFRTKAKWAVKKGADRWTLEVAVPCDEIGSKCMEGMDWRFNAARSRFVSGMKSPESTSSCNGHFHGVSNFIHLKLK